MTATLDTMPTKGRPHVTIRVDPETLDALDALAVAASNPLRQVTRSDVARFALEAGIAKLRAELEPEAPAAPARKRSKAPAKGAGAKRGRS
jgi:hypothetical protein